MGSSVLLAAVVILTYLVVSFQNKRKQVGHLPGFRAVLDPLCLPGVILPTSRFNPGLSWQWTWRRWVYQYYGTRTISSVPLVYGRPLIITGSTDVADQVLSAGTGYWKAPDWSAALMLWGDNVISTNYDDYKRHRRIVGPALTGSTYALVTREAVRLYHEMIEGENWTNLDQVCLPNINAYMAKLALGVIARCGFGLPFSWFDDDTGGPPLSDLLKVVSEGVFVRLAAPRWAYALPSKTLRNVDEAYNKLAVVMSELVAERKKDLGLASESLRGYDLFTRLVAASQAEGKRGLDDSELIGNTFAFMFAGHETTAHVLAAAISLLALYEDEQETAWQQIREVLPDGKDPTLEDLPKLGKVLACFQEAVRMFPAGSLVTRDTTETVTIKLGAEHENRTLVLPPGVRVLIDMVGVHYDPALFPEPERFKPSRWYGVAETDLTFFGMGPRACLGRKFAMTEGVCLLTMVLRDWRLDVILQNGETRTQWADRVLQGSMAGLAFGIRKAPIRLTRR